MIVDIIKEQCQGSMHVYLFILYTSTESASRTIGRQSKSYSTRQKASPCIEEIPKSFVYLIFFQYETCVWWWKHTIVLKWPVFLSKSSPTMLFSSGSSFLRYIEKCLRGLWDFYRYYKKSWTSFTESCKIVEGQLRTACGCPSEPSR